MSCKLSVYITLLLLGAYPLFSMDSISIDEECKRIHVSEMDQYIDSSSQLTYDQFISDRHLFFKSPDVIQGTRTRSFTYWMSFTIDIPINKSDDFFLTCTKN